MMTLGKSLNRKHIILTIILLVILSVIPFFSSLSIINLFTRIFILAVYGMSYDILRGYTGFINLGHAMFFGSGAYIVGILFTNFGANIPVFLLAIIVTVVFSSICAFLMGKISLRGGGNVLTATMITMALGEIVRNSAERWRSVTNGADGLTFRVPDILRDRLMFYYFALLFLIVMAIVLRKFIMSPTGRVLLAIRENEQRAQFLGYNVEKYKLISLQVAGIAGGLAGIMFGIFNRFANTDLLSIQQTLNALLYTLVGGTGTLYGGIVGSAVVNVVQNILLTLRSVHPIFERWLIFFGSMYVLVVLFMPQGFVGLWLKYRENKKRKDKETAKIEASSSS